MHSHTSKLKCDVNRCSTCFAYYVARLASTRVHVVYLFLDGIQNDYDILLYMLQNTYILFVKKPMGAIVFGPT